MLDWPCCSCAANGPLVFTGGEMEAVGTRMRAEVPSREADLCHVVNRFFVFAFLTVQLGQQRDRGSLDNNNG